MPNTKGGKKHKRKKNARETKQKLKNKNNKETTNGGKKTRTT